MVDISSCHLEEDGLLADSELSRDITGGGELDLDGAGGTKFGFESSECWDGDALEVFRGGGYGEWLYTESMDCGAVVVGAVGSAPALFVAQMRRAVKRYVCVDVRIANIVAQEWE
jgi:hypothetical protein